MAEELESERASIEEPKSKKWDGHEFNVTVVSHDKKQDDVYYEIELTSQSTKETTFIFRGLKEVQWLHRFCEQKTNIGGHILHPSPTQPYQVSPQVSELDLDSHALYGKVFRKSMRAVESFFDFIMESNFFSSFPEVQDFFSDENASSREELVDEGVISSLFRAYSNYQYAQMADPEQKLTDALERLDAKLPLLLAAGEACEKNLDSQKTLAVSMRDVILLLSNLSSFEADSGHKESSQYLVRLSEGLEYCKQCRFDVAVDMQTTLSFTLDLYYHFHRQLKAMLLRRRKCLQHLHTCRTQLEKAKPQKKEEADEMHKAADTEYENVTAVAKEEVKAFQVRYAKAMRQALQDHCEAEISHCNKTVNCLASLVAELKN